tara:strand:- start:174 stop:1142 length:969 start_codon:yes stop_codon:yes gene_type:complete
VKKAIITGISGQDGSYLAELLLEKGYQVWGLLRRHSVSENQTSRLDEIGILSNPNLELVYGDITDLPSLLHLFDSIRPDEIYNLAAQSHVRISFDQPAFTTMTDANGVLNLLEAARLMCPDARIYQAGSSEMFGNEVDEDGYQRETTPMLPVSPYGCAKLYAYNLCRTYRASYNMFISNGILFNHESPRRGLNFVTNKIVEGAVNIKKGKQKTLALGNLDATRDWGHAKDYVRAMWIMLQADAAGDFVCATGESYSVRHLCDLVFYKLDIDVGKYVTIDEKYFRPTELHDLRGDCSKLKRVLGWEPEYTFDDLIEEMIEARL